MFLKQYNYKPRSNSGSSGSDSAVDSSKTASVSEQAAAATSLQSRRRSSTTEKFAGLQGHKRTSGDQGAAERRSSIADQKPGGGGVLGTMWQNFTKGT